MKRNQGTLEITIFQKQRQFLESPLDDILFGGSAGSGKSYVLLLFAAQRRMQYPKSHGVIFRRTFRDLERSLIMLSQEIFPFFGAKYNGAEHVWKFPNGAIQRFAHLEAEKNVYDHRSAEYQDICFDEASLFTEFQITYLTSRLRSTIPGMKPLLRLASNPGGVGHSFLRRRYIIPSESQKIWIDPITKQTRTFIPAKVTDNPILMKNNPQYVSMLKGLPEKQRMALLEGRWDVYEGQFFSEFDPKLHVLNEVRQPDSFTFKYLSMDWGYSQPACVLWHEITPLGRVFTYRELYVTGRAPKELAADILTLSPKKEKYEGLWIPPELFGTKIELEGGGEPIADLIKNGLEGRMMIHKANNARIAGWQKMREYMGLSPDGFPWWQISPNCTNLIRTIPDMIFDTKEGKTIDDLDTMGEDHGVDAARYFLVGLKDAPKSIISPYQGTSHQVFGSGKSVNSLQSFLPKPKRGGY